MLVRGDTKLLTTVAIAVVVMNFISRSLSFVQSNLIAHFAQRLQLGLVLEFGRQILRLPLSLITKPVAVVKLLVVCKILTRLII